MVLGLTILNSIPLAWPLASGAAVALAGHLSATAAAWRGSRRDQRVQRGVDVGALTILRPLAGLEAYSEKTLRSTFELDHADVTLLFCVENAADPIIPLVQRVIKEFPNRRAALLVGHDNLSSNPKLNNLVKGWDRTTTDWVAFVDSNVNLPKDAIARLGAAWDSGCGMVCTPPIGSLPDGLPAELECAFLNGYEARWQIAADAVGLGFAQGKVMFFRRSLLTQAGGLSALAVEPAEDAAATKVVRSAGLDVHLISNPFEQPLGPRTFAAVVDRQARWAKLRRATFPHFFLPEILTSAAVPAVLASCAAFSAALPVAPIVMAYLGIWYSAELAFVARRRWVISWWTLPLAIVRDLLIPAIWVAAICNNRFQWQGHAMRTDDSGASNAV